MNDLGLTLAWLAVQVALVLSPSMVLHALASRRSPASGAWVATWSLGLVAVLGFAAFLPGIEPRPGIRPASAPSPGATFAKSDARAADTLGRSEGLDPSGSSSSRGLTFEGLRSAWARFERRATLPAARMRPWGQALAIVALVGSGVGLFRLLVGLWAVGLCRKKGRRVEDPAMIGLVDELRGLMGCRPTVELREVADLATPATGGWRSPMLLLPDDWRSWDDSERRAVVAHELAHILRGDYAAGLLARVVVVLHSYHPLVRWMAARLHLQQELAADSLGARFAGGRTSYLVALASLALKQDGRSPGWPARAFLPARGTLIRRIKMLRTENEAGISARGWSSPKRLATAMGLIVLTAVVATLKGPAHASDGPTPLSVEVKATPYLFDDVRPFDVSYVPEGTMGVVAIRPAAASRKLGLGTPVLKELLGGDLSDLLGEFSDGKSKVDTTRPGFLKLGPEDIETVVAAIKFGKLQKAVPGPDEPEKLHTIEIGETGGLTVRTVAPFDWLAFLRQWKIDLEEVRETRGVYHKIKVPIFAELGLHVGIYLPDDRTLVYEKEDLIKKIIARDAPSAPAYLRGADWERVSRGLLAVAINNENDTHTKGYDLGRPDDAMVLTLFKGVDRWVFGVAASDPIALQSEATGRDPQSAESVARSIKMLVDLGHKALEAEPPAGGEHDRAIRMYKGWLANLKSRQDGRSLVVSTGGSATFADLAAIIKAEIKEEKAQAAEAEAKKVKR